MKKTLIVLVILSSSFLFQSPAFSGDIKNPRIEVNEWSVYSEKNDYAGLIKKENNQFVFYDKNDISLEEKKDFWAMYNQEHTFLGTLKKHDNSSFMLYDANENYLGIILSTRDFRARGTDSRKTKITKKVPKIITNADGSLTQIEVEVVEYQRKQSAAKIQPEAIKLYLYCLKVIDTI